MSQWFDYYIEERTPRDSSGVSLAEKSCTARRSFLSCMAGGFFASPSHAASVYRRQNAVEYLRDNEHHGRTARIWLGHSSTPQDASEATLSLAASRAAD